MPFTSSNPDAARAAAQMASTLALLLERRGTPAAVTICEVGIADRPPARFARLRQRPLLAGLPSRRRVRLRLDLQAGAFVPGGLRDLATLADLARPLRAREWAGAIDEAAVELRDGTVVHVGPENAPTRANDAPPQDSMMIVGVTPTSDDDHVFPAGELRLLRHGGDVELRNVAPARPVWRVADSISKALLLRPVATTRILDLVCPSLEHPDAAVQSEARGLGIRAIHPWERWPAALTVEFDRDVAPFELVQLEVRGARPDGIVLNPVVCTAQRLRETQALHSAHDAFNTIDGVPPMIVRPASPLPLGAPTLGGTWGEICSHLHRQFPWFRIELERGILVDRSFRPEVWACVRAMHADPPMVPVLLESVTTAVELAASWPCVVQMRVSKESAT